MSNALQPSSQNVTIVFPEASKKGPTLTHGTKVLDAEGNEISVSKIELTADVNNVWTAKLTTLPNFLGNVIAQTNKFETPAIGQEWPGQGGVYAGIIRDGDRYWHLILATSPKSKVTGEWGGYGNEIAGNFSAVDGAHNTELLLSSQHDHPVNRMIAALTIEGFSDYYLPSRKELSLLEINLPDHMEKVWHWSSTQYSARYAWVQHFEVGYQDINDKSSTLAARAVRRLPIQ